MEETAQYFEKWFFITDLRFSLPFQNFMLHNEILRFCHNPWSPPNLEPHCETSVDPTVWLRRVDAAAGAIYGG
jgi:hypothetical protein